MIQIGFVVVFCFSIFLMFLGDLEVKCDNHIAQAPNQEKENEHVEIIEENHDKDERLSKETKEKSNLIDSGSDKYSKSTKKKNRRNILFN